LKIDSSGRNGHDSKGKKLNKRARRNFHYAITASLAGFSLALK